MRFNVKFLFFKIPKNLVNKKKKFCHLNHFFKKIKNYLKKDINA
jgi:hypothetical protein